MLNVPGRPHRSIWRKDESLRPAPAQVSALSQTVEFIYSVCVCVCIHLASVTRDSESGKALEILDRQSELLVGFTAQCLHVRIGVGVAEITKLSEVFLTA